jgi:hypothetical protein
MKLKMIQPICGSKAVASRLRQDGVRQSRAEPPYCLAAQTKSAIIASMDSKVALIIVDLQEDFCPPVFAF